MAHTKPKLKKHVYLFIKILFFIRFQPKLNKDNKSKQNRVPVSKFIILFNIFIFRYEDILETVIEIIIQKIKPIYNEC